MAEKLVGFVFCLFGWCFGFFLELRPEPRALHLLGEHSSIALNPQPPTLVVKYCKIPVYCCISVHSLAVCQNVSLC